MSPVSLFTLFSHKQLCVAGIASEMSVWEGVVVTPSDKAYEKMDKDDEDKDEGDEPEETMETQES